MSQTWIDLQPHSVVDAAKTQGRAEDPQAWAVLAAWSPPRYALCAYLMVGHAQDLPFSAGMVLIEGLGGSVGLDANAAGLSPYAATVCFAYAGARSTAGERDRAAQETLSEAPATGAGR